MKRTLEQIQLALNGKGIILQSPNKRFFILYYSYSMIIVEEEFWRVFTWNAQNECWEIWGIDYDHEDIQCLDDLKNFFHKEEKYYANCEEENNPYYEIEMKRLGMI